MKIAITITIIVLLLAMTGIALAPAYILSLPVEATPDAVLSHPASTDAKSPTVESEEKEIEPPPEPVITDITLSFVGDLMLATDRGGEYAGSFNKLANEVEPSYFLENFIELFESDDWTIGNLENVFTDDPTVQPRDKGYTPAYWYKSKTANTAILNAGSVEVVSLANNHSEDYGKKGYSDTRDALDEADVIWGDNNNMVILEKEGFKIAVYCTTFYYNSYDLIISKKLAETEADYKIVYFHGGTERVHVPDSWKATGAHRMIDNGADLVIGGHPHVLQPIEIYKGKTIIHSLGNFCFGGSRSEENRTMVYRLYLQLTDGELTSVTDEVIPCYLYSDLYKPAIITDETDKANVMAFLNGEIESPIVK
ncbi:MAG: CapA family protein [Clostridiales bacterium]|nr:CapA family protein [Clostridiales bacterium]